MALVNTDVFTKILNRLLKILTLRNGCYEYVDIEGFSLICKSAYMACKLFFTKRIVIMGNMLYLFRGFSYYSGIRKGWKHWRNSNVRYFK